MPLMSENGTARIEFISKCYEKALRNQTNHGNKKKKTRSTPTLKTLVIALQVELVF